MSWLARLLPFVKRKELERAALLRRRGDELTAERRFDEATRAYEESIRLDKSNHAAYLKLARMHRAAFQPQEADDTLQRLADADPGNTETYRELIRVYLSSDRRPYTRETLERCLALGTQDANYYLTKSYCAQLKYGTADAGDGRAVVEETIDAAQKSIELDPTNVDAYHLLARGLSWRNDYAGVEEWDEIIRALEKGVEQEPNAYYAWSSLSWAYFSAGRYEDALAVCDRLLELNPSDNVARLLRAKSYAYLGRFQEAVETMRDALERQEGARLWLGGHRSAMDTLKRVVESDTDDARVRSACLFASYANALFSRTAYKWDSPSQGDEAVNDCLSWYERAAGYSSSEPDPLEWQVHQRAGVEYLRGGMYEKARATLRQAAALHPDTYADYEVANHKYQTTPLEDLSECLVQMGEPAEAVAARREHVEMLRRTCEGLRARVSELEAQPSGSYPEWHLSSLAMLLRWCEEYEAKASQNLEGLSGEARGDSE